MRGQVRDSTPPEVKDKRDKKDMKKEDGEGGGMEETRWE